MDPVFVKREWSFIVELNGCTSEKNRNGCVQYSSIEFSKVVGHARFNFIVDPTM